LVALSSPATTRNIRRPRMFTAGVTEALRNYFRTKHVPIAISSTVVGTTRTYQNLDEIVADVENARVWGGLHFRTTMTPVRQTLHADRPRHRRRHFLTGANGYARTMTTTMTVTTNDHDER